MKDISEKRFGTLVAKWPAGMISYDHNRVIWLCLCDCGQLVYRTPSQLARPQNNICGCKHGNYTHGYSANGGSIIYIMYKNAKRRAKRLAIPFDIKPSDIEIPDECPLLHIPLIKQSKERADNSPSLDRKEPSLGYVKGNIWVISYKANTMKNSASLAELKTFIENCQKELLNGEQLFSDTQGSLRC